jgi:hypothetical protein
MQKKQLIQLRFRKRITPASRFSWILVEILPLNSSWSNLQKNWSLIAILIKKIFHYFNLKFYTLYELIARC